MIATKGRSPDGRHRSFVASATRILVLFAISYVVKSEAGSQHICFGVSLLQRLGLAACVALLVYLQLRGGRRAHVVQSNENFKSVCVAWRATECGEVSDMPRLQYLCSFRTRSLRDPA